MSRCRCDRAGGQPFAQALAVPVFSFCTYMGRDRAGADLSPRANIWAQCLAVVFDHYPGCFADFGKAARGVFCCGADRDNVCRVGPHGRFADFSGRALFGRASAAAILTGGIIGLHAGIF